MKKSLQRSLLQRKTLLTLLKFPNKKNIATANFYLKF